MTMKVSILIGADGKAAKVEIEGVGSALTKTGTAADAMGRKGAAAATGTRTLGSAAARAEAQVEALAAAQMRGAATAGQFGQANRLAAGQLGNLTAQFNDIGMMLAAGQNPLQLALQQGPQITQVIGPMGAAGAVKALGAAFLQMLNPVSLVTIGVIAGGAALVQWAMAALGAGDETEDFADQMERLEELVSTYRAAADLAASSTSGLVDRFGDVSEELRPVLAYLEEFARVDAIRALDAAVADLTDRFGGLSRTDLIGDGLNRLQPEILVTLDQMKRELGLTEDQAVAVVLALEGLSTAGSMAEKIAAAAALNEAFRQVFGTVEQIPLPLLDAAREAGLLAVQAAEIEGAMDDGTAAILRAADAYRQTRAEAQVAAEAEAEAQGKANDRARAMLSDLQGQAQIAATIVLFGEDSAEATAVRARQEREAFERLVASLGASEDLTDELLAAYDAVALIAGADPAGPISAAANEAGRLADELSRAVNNAISLGAQGVSDLRQAEIQYDFRDDPVGRAAALARERFDAQTADAAGSDSTIAAVVEAERRSVVENAAAAERLRQETIAWQRAQAEAGNTASGAGAGAGGRGADETERQRDAVRDLIAGLEDELAILRETDPVQQEMLRNREALAGATGAERDQVEELIRTREAEVASLESQRELYDSLRDIGFDVFDGLIRRGDSLSDALANVLGRMSDMVLQATLLGEGPLAGLFGTASSGPTGGGLFGQMLGAVFPGTGGGKPAPKRYAVGGTIYGPGGDTEDRVPILASPGETIVNAKASRRHSQLLAAMNAGAPLSGLAGSRQSAAAAMAPSGPAAASGKIAVAIGLDSDLLDARIARVSGDIVAHAIGQFDKRLPGRIAGYGQDPRHRP